MIALKLGFYPFAKQGLSLHPLRGVGLEPVWQHVQLDDVEASPCATYWGGDAGTLHRDCGVGVHRDNFTATVLTSKGYETRKFEKDLEGIEAFKAWLMENRCRAMVMESTGVYWIPLYSALESEFDVKLANAQKTKRLLGKKTDKVDSKRLASLLRGGLTEACYVPERKIHVLRELTRLRTKMVQNRTDHKNRAHKAL